MAIYNMASVKRNPNLNGFYSFYFISCLEGSRWYFLLLIRSVALGHKFMNFFVLILKRFPYIFPFKNVIYLI